MPKLTSFPEFDSSDSTTHGDDQRIVLMKGALLSELVQQPRVLTEYTQWPVKAGLYPLVRDVLDGIEPVTKLISAIPPAAKLLQEDAVRLAAELNLPYRWVAKDLLHGFGAGLVGIATGQEIVLPLSQINAPRDPMQKRPAGRRPKEGLIEQHARWYVRRRISGITVNSLAKEYHKTHQKTHHNPDHTWQEDRKMIQDGIKEIARLLKLTR